MKEGWWVQQAVYSSWHSLEFRFGTDSKDGDRRDLAANHFLPAWPDTETGPKQINRNASCEMACHVGAKRTGTCRGSARMPPSHSLDIAFRDDHQATRHDSLLCPDTSDQWCIAGLYAGIRRIPTSGVFWQRILTSVIINKQDTFRPFAAPLCVYPPPFLAIHHCFWPYTFFYFLVFCLSSF